MAFRKELVVQLFYDEAVRNVFRRLPPLVWAPRRVGS